MSARRTTQDASTPALRGAAVAARPRKKKTPRVRLTHLEVRRGDTLRLRIAIAADAMAEVGHELGALIKKIAPTAQQPPQITEHAAPAEPAIAAPAEADFVVSRTHIEHDAAYHAKLREHLVELVESLCETGLEDALDVVRQEFARRAEGTN